MPMDESVSDGLDDVMDDSAHIVDVVTYVSSYFLMPDLVRSEMANSFGEMRLSYGVTVRRVEVTDSHLSRG